MGTVISASPARQEFNLLYDNLHWLDQLCLEALHAEAGINTVIDLGPGSDLAKLIEAEHPRISARSVDEFRDWHAVGNWLESRSDEY